MPDSSGAGDGNRKPGLLRPLAEIDEHAILDGLLARVAEDHGHVVKGVAGVRFLGLRAEAHIVPGNSCPYPPL